MEGGWGFSMRWPIRGLGWENGWGFAVGSANQKGGMRKRGGATRWMGVDEGWGLVAVCGQSEGEGGD